MVKQRASAPLLMVSPGAQKTDVDIHSFTPFPAKKNEAQTQANDHESKAFSKAVWARAGTH
jgi:hypothetical protein